MSARERPNIRPKSGDRISTIDSFSMRISVSAERIGRSRTLSGFSQRARRYCRPAAARFPSDKIRHPIRARRAQARKSSPDWVETAPRHRPSTRPKCRRLDLDRALRWTNGGSSFPHGFREQRIEGSPDCDSGFAARSDRADHSRMVNVLSGPNMPINWRRMSRRTAMQPSVGEKSGRAI